MMDYVKVLRRASVGKTATMTAPSTTDGVPARAGFVLAALIGVATVANLNLSVANVALPDIGRHFDASQVAIDAVAVGFSLGLAGTVLWLGALGDRYGRKQMLLIGMALSVPASIVAAHAPSIWILALARITGGVAAGMAYPTTLALITALWASTRRTKAIALWSGIGGAMSSLGPMVAGALLLHYWWGSVFLITVPLALIAFVAAWRLVPAHVGETTERVDNLGGSISVVMVASAVIAITIAPEPSVRALAIVLACVAVVAVGLFVLRQRHVDPPLYDLKVASRRTFWVAAVAGMLVFGALVGSMFVGQQYLQNVLGYSTLAAGMAILPGAALMVVSAPVAARIIERRGSRDSLIAGYLAVGSGFVVMLVGWSSQTSYAVVALAYALLGMGVGLAGPPASRSLTESVPRTRAGMASATADLQRDLGGAMLQAILGAMLTAGYAKAFARQIANAPSTVSDTVTAQLTKSFASAETIAAQYPEYSDAIATAAKQSFIDGQRWAFGVGIASMAIGLVVVWFGFPAKARESEMVAGYATADADRH